MKNTLSAKQTADDADGGESHERVRTRSQAEPPMADGTLGSLVRWITTLSETESSL